MTKRPYVTPTGWTPTTTNDGHPTTEYTHPHHPGVRIALNVCDGRWLLSRPATPRPATPRPATPRPATKTETETPRPATKTETETSRHWAPIDAAYHFQQTLKEAAPNPNPNPNRKTPIT